MANTKAPRNNKIVFVPETHKKYVIPYTEKFLLGINQFVNHSEKNALNLPKNSSQFKNNANLYRMEHLFRDETILINPRAWKQKVNQISEGREKFNNDNGNKILNKLDLPIADINIPVKKSAYVAAALTKHAEMNDHKFFGVMGKSISNIFKDTCTSWKDYKDLFKESLDIQNGNGHHWGSELHVIDLIANIYKEKDYGEDRSTHIARESLGAPNEIHRYALDYDYQDLHGCIIGAKKKIKNFKINLKGYLERNLINFDSTNINFDRTNLVNSFKEISQYSDYCNYDITNFIDFKICEIQEHKTSIQVGVGAIEKEFVVAVVDSFKKLLKPDNKKHEYNGLARDLKSANDLDSLGKILSKTRSKLMVNNIIEYNDNLKVKEEKNEKILNTDHQGDIRGVIVGANHAKHILEWQQNDQNVENSFEIIEFEQINNLEEIVNTTVSTLITKQLESNNEIEETREKKSEKQTIVQNNEMMKSFSFLKEYISSENMGRSSDDELCKLIPDAAFFKTFNLRDGNHLGMVRCLVKTCKEKNLRNTLKVIWNLINAKLGKPDRIDLLINSNEKISFNYLDDFFVEFLIADGKLKLELSEEIDPYVPFECKKARKHINRDIAAIKNRSAIAKNFIESNKEMGLIFFRLDNLFKTNDLSLSNLIDAKKKQLYKFGANTITQALNNLQRKEMTLSYKKLVEVKTYIKMNRYKKRDEEITIKPTHNLILNLTPHYAIEKSNRPEVESFSLVAKLNNKKLFKFDKLDATFESQISEPICLTQEIGTRSLELELFQNISSFFSISKRITLGSKQMTLNKADMEKRIKFNGDEYKGSKYSFNIQVKVSCNKISPAIEDPNKKDK